MPLVNPGKFLNLNIYSFKYLLLKIIFSFLDGYEYTFNSVIKKKITQNQNKIFFNML
jgi:hypothetical protein